MVKKKPMSKEERLKKKRDCEKRRRERIKESLEATEALKTLKHKIYERLKEEGKVKLINDLPKREQRAICKKWRTNTRNRRQRMKDTENKTKAAEPYDLTQEIFPVVQIGDFVAVGFQDNWYPGVVKSIDDNIATVHFMERRGVDKSIFKWPERKPDEQRICISEILDKLPNPQPVLPLRIKCFSFYNSNVVDQHFNTI